MTWTIAPILIFATAYYISPNHDAIRRVAVDFMIPNGIIGTPDGSLANRRFVASYGSDGMTIDERGANPAK